MIKNAKEAVSRSKKGFENSVVREEQRCLDDIEHATSIGLYHTRIIMREDLAALVAPKLVKRGFEIEKRKGVLDIAWSEK